VQCEAFTSADKGGASRCFIDISTWWDGLCNWSWEFHWCQCHLPQVVRCQCSASINLFLSPLFCQCLLTYCALHLRILSKFASQAANDALSTLLRFSVQDSVCKIHRMDYSLFRWVFHLHNETQSPVVFQICGIWCISSKFCLWQNPTTCAIYYDYSW
jgi:hypothetical protein